MNENQLEKKERDKAEKAEKEKANDHDQPAENRKSYYYDDGHGYEVYQPKPEREEKED